MNRIYLDNAATTPLAPEVLEAMMPYLTQFYGNASGIYETGRAARKAVDQARRQLADLIGCKPGELYFTSGGTESDNWALKGIAFANRHKNHIITSAIEHHAILRRDGSNRGFEISCLPVDASGRVDPAAVEEAIRSAPS